MLAEARRLVAWGTLGGAALIGCRENVYLGSPIALTDHALPDADGPDDGPSPGDADAPVDVRNEPEPPFPWYLHGVGSKIFDSDNGPVRLHGISWSGMQTVARVPDGLHRRTIDSIVGQIKDLGFDFIRIPFSSESLSPTSMPTPTSMINPIGGDPDLVGMSSIQILDRIVDAAFRHHLRVILDHYRFLADASLPSKTWYSGPDPDSPVGGYPESRWQQDWVTLATRYAQKPSVVGCDLHDEPMTPSTWGDNNANFDWRLAAERAGNAILDANPNLVILVEGIDVAGGQPYWAGGNLRAARDAPVRLKNPQKLFYAVKDWGRSVNTDEPWFTSPNYPNNLPMLWDDTWRYLVTTDRTPVVIVAFGDQGNSQPNVPPEILEADRLWRAALTSYIDDNQLSYAFWALNPSAEGRSGLLQLVDWQTPDPNWVMLLGLKP